MDRSELRIQADGIDYTVRTAVEKPKRPRRALLERRKTTVEQGKLESLTSFTGEATPKPEERQGIFYSRWDEYNSEDFSIHTTVLHTQNRLIEITETVNYCGCGEASGVVKTRNHWYEKWKQTRLENLKVYWDFLPD